MLVCNVSQQHRGASIVADIAEVATAADQVRTVVFDDVITETTNAADVLDAGFSHDVAILETGTATDASDGTVVSAPTSATFESATVASVTLSGGNLVATNTGTTSTNQGAHVASASGKTTGKYYVEFTITTYAGGAGVGVGVAKDTATYSNLSNLSAGNGGNMCFVVGHTGSGTISTDTGNSGLSLGAMTSGDVICVATDVTNRRQWFRKGAAGSWNGTGGDPTNPTSGGGATIVSGTIIPFCTFGSGPAGAAGVSGNVITANFGASSFVGTAPSGYTAGWPA